LFFRRSLLAERKEAKEKLLTPIVFIPGLICTAEVFAPQVAALWPYGSVTVASTLEGTTMAEIASAILDSAPPKFALAGISMGGYIAFEIMRLAPERVLKLALLDTSPLPDTPEQTSQRRAFISLAQTGDYEALLSQAMPTMFHPEHQDDPGLCATSVRMGLIVGVEGLIRQEEAVLTRVDSRPVLASIKVPTLVLVGDKDPLTPPSLAKDMSIAIPGARLVIIPECGHSSTTEQPEAVNQALIEWITR
jgi:pimeloyl-ACP methyl ester carboxylesterase